MLPEILLCYRKSPPAYDLYNRLSLSHLPPVAHRLWGRPHIRLRLSCYAFYTIELCKLYLYPLVAAFNASPNLIKRSYIQVITEKLLCLGIC